MPIGRPGERDRYGRRSLLAAAAALLLLILGALLGPSAEQMQELLLHTGVEGPTQLLTKIDVIPDDAELTLERQRSMPTATQGVPLPDRLLPPTESADPAAPKSAESGLIRPEHWTTRLSEDSDAPERELQQPELHSASQRSLDFILEAFVKPEYPRDATPAARARVVTVKVAMYINELGQVAEAYIEESDGGPLFDAAVLQAVRRWRYRPITIDRAPQGFWDKQIVRFVVSKQGTEVEFFDG